MVINSLPTPGLPMPPQEPSAAAHAEGLEQQAGEALQAGNLQQAAQCLGQASASWALQGEWLRQGVSGLLAASLWRRAGHLQQAGEVLAVLAASNLPPRQARGVVLEACEQHLAAGRPREALRGFNEFWARYQSQLEPEQRLEVLQRRAAAAWAGQGWGQAAQDLELAAALGTGTQAAANALLAVLAQGRADPRTDGPARWRRALPESAGQALAAASRAGMLAWEMGDARAAFDSLALSRTEWARRHGSAEAEALFAPALQALRETLGEAAFLAAQALHTAAQPGRPDGFFRADS